MMVPMVVESTSKGDRVFDIFSQCLRDRIVFINGPIATEMSHVVAAQLLYLEAADPTKDISIYINSVGGSVTAGVQIYSVMQHISPRITTIVTAEACSMGSVLAQAGSPGQRFMVPESRMMLHAVSGGHSGNVWDAEIQLEEMQRLNTQLTNIYVKHNSKGKTFEDFKAIMARDSFMTPDQAIEFGLADAITTSRKIVS